MSNSINNIGQRGREYLLDRDAIVMDESFNIRSNYGDIEGEDLSSIETQGIKQPLLGFMDEGKFYGCDGFRRIRKYDYLVSQGMEPFKIPCKLDQRAATQEGRVLIALEMSSGRPLDMFERGRGYQYLKNESGYTLERIAASVGKSKQHIIDCLAILEKAPEEIQVMIQDKKISATEALEIFREDADNAVEIIQDAVEIAKNENKTKATKQHVKKAREKSEDSTVGSELLHDDSVEKSELADFLTTVTKEEWLEFDLSLLRKLSKKLTK